MSTNTLAATASAKLSVQFQKSDTLVTDGWFVNDQNANGALELALRLAYGTGDAQANQVYAAERTLLTTVADPLDLNGSMLQDVYGVNLALVKIKALVIQNMSGVAIKVGVGSNPITTILGGTTPFINIPVGGVFCIFSDVGFAVTAGSADILNIVNATSGTTVYNIAIVGCTA